MAVPQETLLSGEMAQQSARNYRLLVYDILWFGIALPSLMRFLSLYTIRIDASALVLALQSALPAIFALVSSSFALWWARHFSSMTAAQFWPGIGQRLAFLLPAFTPYFPKEWQPVWLVASISLTAIPQGISSVLFMVIMREGVESSRIMALTSRRSLVFNISVGIGTLLFGVWLEEVSYPINYQIMFVVSFMFSLISQLDLHAITPVFPEKRPASGQSSAKPWRAPAFQQVALVTVATHVALFALGPIIALRLVDELGADEGFMSIFAVIELTAASLASATTNRLARRYGIMAITAVGMIFTGLSALNFALATNPWLTLPGAALGGLGWTAAAICLFGYFNESVPPDNLTAYSTSYNQVVMLSIFVAPLLGSQLPSLGFNLIAVLVIGAVLRIAVGAWVVLRRW